MGPWSRQIWVSFPEPYGRVKVSENQGVPCWQCPSSSWFHIQTSGWTGQQASGKWTDLVRQARLRTESPPAQLVLQPAKLKARLPPRVQRVKGKGNLIQTGLGLARRKPSSSPHISSWRAHSNTETHVQQDDLLCPLGVCHHPIHRLLFPLEFWVPGILLRKAEGKRAWPFQKDLLHGRPTNKIQSGRKQHHSNFGEHWYRERGCWAWHLSPRSPCSHTAVWLCRVFV